MNRPKARPFTKRLSSLKFIEKYFKYSQQNNSKESFCVRILKMIYNHIWSVTWKVISYSASLSRDDWFSLKHIKIWDENNLKCWESDDGT